jgi:SpoVK/Ycf46/Vps4 family AAA+-type ATPase
MEMELRFPNDANRIAILSQELIKAGYGGSTSSNINALTQGMSGRDLEQLARKAAMTPLVADFPALTGKIRSAGNPSVDEKATRDTLVLDASDMSSRVPGPWRRQSFHRRTKCRCASPQWEQQ